MKATLIAQTELTGSFAGGITIEDQLGMELDQGSSDAEDLIEFAGRACYQSFHKPNEKTRKNADYIANILRQKHESVLEHASASFYVEGVSRNLLLELERHRHLSFSVESQRFVDSSDVELIDPPGILKALNTEIDAEQYSTRLDVALTMGVDALAFAKTAYTGAVRALIEDHGYTRKQAREAARAILPGGIETKFVVTGNLRAWRDVLRKRYSTHADAEIREFAGEILRQLRAYVAPAVFSDFPDEPFHE